MDDEITIYELSEVRVLNPRTEPGLVVLAIRSGKETTHYAMTLEDLAGLADRLRQDAIILTGPSNGRT